MAHKNSVSIAPLDDTRLAYRQGQTPRLVREVSYFVAILFCLGGMLAMLMLSGCGVSGSGVAETPASAPVALGSLQGSNYGGHAPLVGAQVYVLEATTNGYGSAVKSLLSSTYSNPNTTYLDSSGDATNGDYYVQTDGQGNFNVTGDYTCDPGRPVYLYAAGGNPRTNPSVTITGATVSGSYPVYTITFTTGGQLLYSGESISFAGSGGYFAGYINGLSSVVLSNANLTTTGFQITVNTITRNFVTVVPGFNYTSSLLGTVTASQAGSQSNPAIANTAMLGVCPSTGSANFSYLNFVYMNEVSTVAMAYAMAPFAVDSLHIGSSSTNLVGLQNAANMAGLLYNIQGNGPGSTTADGDYHTANQTNPNNSYGTVPYKTINTLANIVANCVDSANTVVGTSATELQNESPQCSGLFTTATSDGNPVSVTAGGSTVPMDTATAMINLAHYPAGVNTIPGNTAVDSANPSTLFNLPTGNVPFTPQLSSAPTDWTLPLTYSNIASPGPIAIDASGNAYIGTYSSTAGYITELSPQGAVTATSTVPVPNMGALAISPTVSSAYTVWTDSNSNGKVYKFSSSLAASNSYTSAYTIDPTSLAIDSSGNVYVVNNSANSSYYYISEFNSTGAVINHTNNYQFSVANGLAITTGDTLWISGTNSNVSLYPNPSSGSGSPTSSGSVNAVSAIALDSQGYVWAAGKTSANQALARTTGGSNSYYAMNGYNNETVGGVNNPVALAVDGSNANYSNTFNVWLANSGNNTVSEINSGAATDSSLSPSVGYLSGTGLINSPSAIAVDNSGNVWVTNQGNSTVVELVGAANPVTTPFSALKPGVEP